jgi:pyrroline-5-carboxylate reductase
LDHFNIPNLHQTFDLLLIKNTPKNRSVLGPSSTSRTTRNAFVWADKPRFFEAEPQIMPRFFLACQTFSDFFPRNLQNQLEITITMRPMTQENHTFSKQTLAFIGGGNMASAILGGLIRQGMPAQQIWVVEPFEESRLRLQQLGVHTLATPNAELQHADLVIWAVKPQSFQEAAQQNHAFCSNALHLSVAAGIRSDSIAHWLGTQRVVRAMPNTPALVGLGQTGLFARPGVSADERQWIEHALTPTGQMLWVEQEALLDAVTALSGSGPAYVFYFIEAMVNAGVSMGLSAEQAHQLAVGTFVGASALAQSSQESPQVLRERVTSKGGTTYAALTSMDAAGMQALFQQALEAARQRAQELGDAFGK